MVSRVALPGYFLLGKPDHTERSCLISEKHILSFFAAIGGLLMGFQLSAVPTIKSLFFVRFVPVEE